MKKKSSEKLNLTKDDIAKAIGKNLAELLLNIQENFKHDLYLTGGTVRDIAMGRQPTDIDLTVPYAAKEWAARFAEATGGTYVVLGRNEDAARVVWKKRTVDFSSFREGATTIEQDLCKRDITINSLGVALDAATCWPAGGKESVTVIDPCEGVDDLAGKIVRAVSPDSFLSDPLRMLRAYRFYATLGFTISAETAALASRYKKHLSRVSAERIAHELDLIMATGQAGDTLRLLAASGILWEIVPELRAGCGMEQPASHHLDVFAHNLAALCRMDKILHTPALYFPDATAEMENYFDAGELRVRLKFAALFHDLGKPATFARNQEKDGRITFYNHDQIGAELVQPIGERLRWSRERITYIANLISLHMRPFHLSNVHRQGNLSLKACLRLLKVIDKDLPGLFLLSMADSLASQGDEHPQDMELEIATLYSHLAMLRKSHILPVKTSAPLLSGKELIHIFRLSPGPLFKKILNKVEDARYEKIISTKEQAITLVRNFLEKTGD